MASHADLRDFLGRRREEPGSFEEFERETGARSARGSEDHLFLQDVAIHGAQGVVEVKHLVLTRAAVAGVGRMPAAAP